jgi:hypothetical protein
LLELRRVRFTDSGIKLYEYAARDYQSRVEAIKFATEGGAGLLAKNDEVNVFGGDEVDGVRTKRQI